MADSVLRYSENIQRNIDQTGIQITTGLKSALLTSRGKSTNALLEEFTADQQGKIKEVFGFVSAHLLKKSDKDYAGTASDIVSEVETKVETTEPEPKE